MPNKILSKQLLYRSTHRGCKETDFLIGKFVTAKLSEITDSKLNLLTKFLEEDDLKIYDWILGKEVVPEGYLELIGEICEFHKLEVRSKK